MSGIAWLLLAIVVFSYGFVLCLLICARRADRHQMPDEVRPRRSFVGPETPGLLGRAKARVPRV